MGDKEKAAFLELTRMPYKAQGIWFLNGFWNHEAEAEAESIWAYANKFSELDPKKKEGNELDEFWSHKFLESIGETLTVLELREKLKKIDMDANGKMALLEYLLFRYNKTVKQTVDAPQGGNQDKILEAQNKLDSVQNSLNAQQASLQAQKAAEDQVKKSEEELRAAVLDLEKQELAYKTQVETLEIKSKDEGASMVSRNKAANELAQLKQEDPLPLRKAKVTQEAALRKVEKERKAAEAATANQEKCVRESEALFAQAHEYLEELKAKGGVAQGSIWWMERELQDAQRFLPKKKQLQKKLII